MKMENTQFRECFFNLVALEGWSCKVCGKNFCRPPYSVLRNHIKDVHLNLYQRVLKNFGAALQIFDNDIPDEVFEEIKSFVSVFSDKYDETEHTAFLVRENSNCKKRKCDQSEKRDPQSEDNRAVRRRLCRKENLIEYYDRIAKKWIFLDEDDPRVAVPGKKLTVGSNSAAPDVDSKSRGSNGGGDSSSSSFNSTSIPSAAPHYHLRSSPVAATMQSQPKKLPPSSQRPSKGKVPSSNEVRRVADADDHISHQQRAEESDAESAESNSATKSNGTRKQRWTTKADEKLQAIVLKHGTQSWKLVATLLGFGWTAERCNRRWNRHLKDAKRPEESKRVSAASPWTSDEDEMLRAIVLQHGTHNWNHVTALLGVARTVEQCKGRWHRRLKKIGSSTAISAPEDAHPMGLEEVIPDGVMSNEQQLQVDADADDSENELVSFCEDSGTPSLGDNTVILSSARPPPKQHSTMMSSSASSSSSSSSSLPNSSSSGLDVPTRGATNPSHNCISPNSSSSNVVNATIEQSTLLRSSSSSSDTAISQENVAPKPCTFVITGAQEQYLEKLRQLHDKNLITIKVWEASQMAVLGISSSNS